MNKKFQSDVQNKFCLAQILQKFSYPANFWLKKSLNFGLSSTYSNFSGNFGYNLRGISWSVKITVSILFNGIVIHMSSLVVV